VVGVYLLTLNISEETVVIYEVVLYRVYLVR